MVSLPLQPNPQDDEQHSDEGGCGTGCGTSCGAGLEKIYPTTAVRFGAMNWIGEFQYSPGTVFKCGAKVVIRSERGVELGQQVSLTCNGCSKSVSRAQIKTYIDNSGAEFYRLASGRILREATARDLTEQERLNEQMREHCQHANLLAAQSNLDMKIVTGEQLLGGERIVFYFRAEERVDFRNLVKLLSQHLHARIELRQVGARDEARLVADYEICGRECCCKNFLKKLRPVSMKMAKVQKSTLDPSKVSGRCGRLRCCLRYEHEGYEELLAKLPRIGAQLRSSYGVVTVVNRQILTQLVVVRTSDERELAVPVEELEPLDAHAPPPAASSSDTDFEDGGEGEIDGPREPQRSGAARPRSDGPAARRTRDERGGARANRPARPPDVAGAEALGDAGAADAGTSDGKPLNDAPPGTPPEPGGDSAGPGGLSEGPSASARRRRRRRRRRGPPGDAGSAEAPPN